MQEKVGCVGSKIVYCGTNKNMFEVSPQLRAKVFASNAAKVAKKVWLLHSKKYLLQARILLLVKNLMAIYFLLKCLR